MWVIVVNYAGKLILKFSYVRFIYDKLKKRCKVHLDCNEEEIGGEFAKSEFSG